jgi:hypothetical protein
MEETKQYTVHIPIYLHTKIKEESLNTGVKIQWLIVNALRSVFDIKK